MQNLIDALNAIFSKGHFSTEAAASLNVRVMYRGREVMVTIREDETGAAFARLDKMLDYVDEAAQLEPEPEATPATNGAPTAQPATPAQQAAAAPFCPIHNRPMKKSQFKGWFCTASEVDETTGERVYCTVEIKE